MYVVFEVAENLKKLPLNILMQFIVSPFQWMELNGLDFSGLWWNDAPNHASMKLSVMIWKTFPSKFTQALFAKGAYRM